MLESIDFDGRVLFLAEPVFYHMPEGRPIRLLFKFGKGGYSSGGFLHVFQQFGVLCGIGRADKALFLAVKFAFHDLEGDDLLKLGHVRGGRYYGVGDAADWC